MFPAKSVYLNFWSRLAATAAGRRHIYSFAIAAEEGDEHGIFDLLTQRVADSAHKKLVRVHQADEERHAGLFRECLERMRATQEEIPAELLIIRRMGDKFGPGGDDSRTVIELYAMLRAIEVRGVEQFPVIAEALLPYDSFGADTFLKVAHDEKRHVGFCDIIGRAEAATATEWSDVVSKYHRMEKSAFLEHGIVSLRYAIRRDLIAATALEKNAERMLQHLEKFAQKFTFIPGISRLQSLGLQAG